VHWVARSADAPRTPGGPTDGDKDRLPDQVEETIRVLKHVWNIEVRSLGFRPPVADGGRRNGQGPNGGIDFYLGDLGTDGTFGYCIADRGRRMARKRRGPRSHVYCVLDNDFDPRQYRSGISGRKALRITVAHEFFHAVQSAYRASRGDRWLREGTATWIEDHVYDAINSNYATLAESPLSQPELPLDRYQAPDDGQDLEYGSWVFWQFLAEYLGPGTIRQVWNRVAMAKPGSGAVRDAVAHVVRRRTPDASRCILFCTGRLDFVRAFVEFSLWTRRFDDSYSEGAGYLASLNGALPVNDAEFLFDHRPTTEAHELSVDHLSSREVVVNLAPSIVAGPTRVAVDLPPGAGAAAVVRATNGNGEVATRAIGLDLNGDGETVLADVMSVSLLLVNASGRVDDQQFRYEVGAP
jgi:hypothetical protein